MLPSKPFSSRPDIAIGMIGPDPIVQKMLQSVKQYPSFRPQFRTFEQDGEAPELARQLMDSVEVILFSGITPYQLALKEISFNIPVHYIPLSGTGLYRVLFCLYQEYGLESLSVDAVTVKEMTQTLKALNLSSIQVTFFNNSVHPSREELLQFHRTQFEQGTSKAILTANHWVANELTKLNIPNQWIMPTEQDIVIALTRALLSSENRRNKESQIVVGLISVDHFEKLAQAMSSEHEVQRFKLDIHRMLLSYIESLDGHLLQLGSAEFFFVTTRGSFEWKTRGYSFIPIGREVELSFDLTLSIGIGFGHTAGEAGTHARMALGHCMDAGGSTCFIVREDKSIIGPVAMTEPLRHDLSLINVDLVQKIRSAGFSLSSLNKLIDYITRTGKTEFIAPELSNILGITVRSVHRNLASLMDANLVVIVGEDRVRPRGKPNQVYRINFIEELIRNEL